MTSEVLIENTTKRYTQKITAGNHTFYGDEPKSLKGDDLGPSPFEHLLSSLGSCSSITLSMYAERKGIELDVISIRLAFMPTDRKAGTKPKISRKIHLEGNFTEAQHTRMLEIADRCPVHRMLEPSIDIMTSAE